MEFHTLSLEFIVTEAKLLEPTRSEAPSMRLDWLCQETGEREKEGLQTTRIVCCLVPRQQ